MVVLTLGLSALKELHLIVHAVVDVDTSQGELMPQSLCDLSSL